MKKMLILFIIFFLSGTNISFAADTDIHLNSLGFLPEYNKKATIVTECSEFEVKKVADGKVVFKGTATGPLFQTDINQNVWTADFSGLREKGRYYLNVPGVGRSIDIEIGDSVFNFAYTSAMRGFYLLRCGAAVRGEHNGNLFEHGTCHLEDGYLDYAGEKDGKLDGTGGWHDAGDYGKYVVNAGVTVGALFLAWDHFQDRLKNKTLDLPDTAPDYPDFLRELKWETDWILKMQNPDGSGKVYHKLTRLRFSGFIMPENDAGKRYFTDWSTAATADFVAMMAMAARYFKPYDAEYADSCLNAAQKSYDFLKNYPDDKRADLRAFSTGGYGTSDPDDRLWAAAELWETTGDPVYLKDFETRALTFDPKIESDWDWGKVRNLGMFTYLLSKKEGKSTELVQSVQRDLQLPIPS